MVTEERRAPAIVGSAGLFLRPLSDRSTKRYYRTYKGAARQQWINEMKIAKEWKEGKEPNFHDKTGATRKTSGPAEVPNEIGRYCEMLFQRKNVDDNAYQIAMERLRKRRILKGAREDMDKKIGRKELQDVMEGLPLGKQAGPDRIPNAVFKMLPTFFATKVEKLIAEIVKKGEMPDYMLRGEISMLYKKDDRDDPRNYRPITLLQNVYKIIANCRAVTAYDGRHAIARPDRRWHRHKRFEC